MSKNLARTSTLFAATPFTEPLVGGFITVSDSTSLIFTLSMYGVLLLAIAFQIFALANKNFYARVQKATTVVFSVVAVLTLLVMFINVTVVMFILAIAYSGLYLWQELRSEKGPSVEY